MEAEPTAAVASAPLVHQLSVTEVPAVYTEEAFQLYSRYQQAVHGDEPAKLTPSSYTRFLCHSTLTVRRTHRPSPISVRLTVQHTAHRLLAPPRPLSVR